MLKNQIGCTSQDGGCSSQTQVSTTGRLLEVAIDCNPREMADSESACHSSGQNPAYRSVFHQRLHGNVEPLAFMIADS